MKIYDKFAVANDLMCRASNESNNPVEDILLPPASWGAFLPSVLTWTSLCISHDALWAWPPHPPNPFLPRPAPDHLNKAAPFTPLSVLISSLHTTRRCRGNQSRWRPFFRYFCVSVCWSAAEVGCSAEDMHLLCETHQSLPKIKGKVSLRLLYSFRMFQR